jgi:hypothetical protein
MGTWGMSYKRVTSDMTVVIIGTWGRSYKFLTSDMTVVIIGTWGRSYKRVNFRHDRCKITTVMSEVTRLYDLP